MRYKVDFVTNSSSEVFSIVLSDGAVLTGLAALLFTLFNGCGNTNVDRDTEAPPIEPDYEEAQAMAQQLANAALEDAKRQDEIIKQGYVQAENTLDDAKTALERELAETKKTWADSETTADKTDPGYAALKKQYDDYMDYLKSQIEQAEYQKQLVEYEKAKKQAEIDSQNEWARQRQADYIAVKEEKAMLEAVAKGYNVPGYNTDAVKVRLKQLSERETELTKVLAENNAAIDYTAKDRGSIGPSQESREINDRIRAEKQLYEEQIKKAKGEKRAQLEAEHSKNMAEAENELKRASRWDMATKAVEGVQYGADVAVDGLSYVTGPAGQQVKLAYTAGKNVAQGMGEGMADPANAGKHLAKGILNATTEVVKEKFGGEGKPWQAAATSILNEGLQNGLDASIKGENVVDAMGKGLTKGVFDAGADKALDAIKDKLPIPKGSSVDVHDYSVSKVLNNNPLSKGILKTGAREVIGGKLKDSAKEAIVNKAGKEGGFGGDD